MPGVGRRRWGSSLPVVLGVAAAVALVTGVYLSGPSVLIPGGTVENVPAYFNGTAEEGGAAECAEHHDCGEAGLRAITFTLASAARLTGTLQVPAPITLAIVNPIGLGGLQCSLGSPPSNCTVEVGGETFEASDLQGTVDLGTLDLGLDGANNVVPAGTWTLCLVNWGPASVPVTVDTAVLESPD